MRPVLILLGSIGLLFFVAWVISEAERPKPRRYPPIDPVATERWAVLREAENIIRKAAGDDA